MEQLKDVLKEVLYEEFPKLLKEELPGALHEELPKVLPELLQKELQPIKEQLDRIERAQTEDVVAMLEVIDKKITARTDRHEHKTSVSNDRLLVVEADVRKLLTT